MYNNNILGRMLNFQIKIHAIPTRVRITASVTSSVGASHATVPLGSRARLALVSHSFHRTLTVGLRVKHLCTFTQTTANSKPHFAGSDINLVVCQKLKRKCITSSVHVKLPDIVAILKTTQVACSRLKCTIVVSKDEFFALATPRTQFPTLFFFLHS